MKVLTIKPKMIKGTAVINKENSDIGVFFLIGGAIGNDIKCICRGFDWKKKYHFYFNLIKTAGGKIFFFDDGFKAEMSAVMKGIEIDFPIYEKSLPAAVLLSVFCSGKSRIKGLAQRDRVIVSDILSEFSHLGARAENTAEGAVIEGVQTLRGDGTYVRKKPYLAMALTIAASRCEGELRIMGTEELCGEEFACFMEIYNKMEKENR